MNRNLGLQEASTDLEYWLERIIEALEEGDRASYKLSQQSFLETYRDAISALQTRPKSGSKSRRHFF